MFKVKDQGHSVSAAKTLYYAMYRFSDFKLGTASYLKWERADVARAASSCNAFAIATFSGFAFCVSACRDLYACQI